MTEYLKQDQQYLNDVANARTQEELSAAGERLRQRQSGVQPNADANNAGNNDARVFEKVVEIGGVSMRFQAGSPEDLQFQIETAEQTVAALQARQDESQQPTAEEVEAARQKELVEQNQRDLDLQAGRISMKDYIEQSHAVENYLESQGLSVNALREQVEERQSASMISAWQQATEAFLARSDWPGTERNKQLLLQQLQIMGLEDRPSVESLEAAYGAMKAAGTVFPREQGEAEILDSLVKSRFGKTVAEASPAELLEVWKQQNEGVAQGDASKANESFISAFRRRG
jgi:hypothetical protein